MKKEEGLKIFLCLGLAGIFGMLAGIFLEDTPPNGKNLYDWLDSPAPQHTCQVSHYEQKHLFGAILQNCHCPQSCYGTPIACRVIRPVLELDPRTTTPNYNYGLGYYCCDDGDCDISLYTCDIVVGNISSFSWTWSVNDTTLFQATWQESYYCTQDDLLCQTQARDKHTLGKQQKCWVQPWKGGQVTLSYPGPRPEMVISFWVFLSLTALMVFVALCILIKALCVWFVLICPTYHRLFLNDHLSSDINLVDEREN